MAAWLFGVCGGGLKAASSKLASSYGKGLFCRRRRYQKIITSDHSGFAGVWPRTMPSPPANILSPELISPALSIFR